MPRTALRQETRVTSSRREVSSPTASLLEGRSEEDKVVSDRSAMSLVELMVVSLWERAAKKGLYRYDVTAYRTHTMPGSHHFLLLLNEGRIQQKRRSEFSVDKVLQPFDATKFNFTKVSMEEVLFAFDARAAKGVEFHPEALAGRSPDLVLINVCPIEYGHVLLVPRVMDELPQQIDASAMKLALEFASAMGSPYFRLIYNSFGAYASVNHLHFQGYFLMAALPSERAPTVKLPFSALKTRHVRVGRLVNYPVRGWVFEMTGPFDQALQPLAEVVTHVCTKLQEMNVPFNMLVVDCGARVLLWPQCFQERQAQGQIPRDLVETDMMPAASEVAGHIIVKRRKDFEEFRQEDVWRLLSLASLTAERFVKLTALCMKSQINCSTSS